SPPAGPSAGRGTTMTPNLVQSAPMSQPPDQNPPAQPPARRAVPGTVLATGILLGVAGGLTVLNTLVQFGGGLAAALAKGFYLAQGLLSLLLAYYIYRAKRWARSTMLVLCAIGIVLGVIRVIGGGSRGVVALASPLVYVVLLYTPSARAW